MSGVGFWVRNLFWPERNLSKLGRVLGALSVFTIVREVFDYPVSQAFVTIIEWYDVAVAMLSGWAEPWLKRIGSAFGDFMNSGQALYPHWNHILVLLGIYFFRNAANNTQHEGTASWVFKYTLSAVFALLFAGATGLIPFNSNDMSANFWIAAIPVLGAWLYDIVYLAWHATFLREGYAHEFKFREQKEQSWTAFFVQRALNASVRYVIGLLLAVILLQIPQIQAIPGAGLLVLGILVIVLGFYWMGRGMSIRRRMIDEGQAPESLPALPSIKLSAEMLGVFVALAVLLLVDTGLKLFG